MTRPRRPSRIWVLWCSRCGWLDECSSERGAWSLAKDSWCYHAPDGKAHRELSVVRYDRAKGAR